jgi:hypothetical protein
MTVAKQVILCDQGWDLFMEWHEASAALLSLDGKVSEAEYQREKESVLDLYNEFHGHWKNCPECN